MSAHPSLLLVDFRARHGLRQVDLARLLTMSVRTLQAWEQVVAKPPPCLPLLLDLLDKHLVVEREAAERQKRYDRYRAEREAEAKAEAKREARRYRKKVLDPTQQRDQERAFEAAERKRLDQEWRDKEAAEAARKQAEQDTLRRKAAAYEDMIGRPRPAERLDLSSRDRRVAAKMIALGRSSDQGDRHAAWAKLGSIAEARGLNPFDLLREVDFGES